MEKSSMFQYLYNGILSQIRAGRYIYGSSLPSAAELCRIYNVGIRTARDVLKALRDDGYIRTEERRRATVIHGTEDAGNEANLRETLARRNCMSEVYDAMELLMTPLLIFCAQQCGDDELLAVDAGAKKWRVFPGLSGGVSRRSCCIRSLKRRIIRSSMISIQVWSFTPRSRF